MAVRLKYAGVDPSLIKVEPDISTALDKAIRSSAPRRNPLRLPHLHIDASLPKASTQPWLGAKPVLGGLRPV